MKTTFYWGLDRAPEAKEIRREVFIEEQGFTHEFDEVDSTALHLLLWDGEAAVATARAFPEPGKQSTWHIGRVAVRKSWRGRHLGYRLLQDLEEKLRSMGIHSVVLSAQVRVQAFYSYCGYLAEGVPYDDEGCPHITMRKFL